MDRTSHTQTKTAKELHLCPSCDSGLVQPVRWEQAGDRGHWRLWRRCPECGWCSDAIHGEREIDAYDENLDVGTQVLSKALKQLESENMRHMADSFAAALDADLLTADDFQL